MEMSREEHVAWCKKRALKELDFYSQRGDTKQAIANAYASLGSDLGKHPETEHHAAIELGMLLMLGGHLQTMEEARKFIDGVN